MNTAFFYSTGFIRVLSLAAVIFAVACSREAAPSEPPVSLREELPLVLDGKAIRAQIAVLPAEMARGLMQRRELGWNAGMLFVYRQPQEVTFWMRNTPLPLDIAFFDSTGDLLEIQSLHPYDETPVVSGSSRIQLALEMNRGWFRENAVRPGALLDLTTVRAALERRGFDPADFGLDRNSGN